MHGFYSTNRADSRRELELAIADCDWGTPQALYVAAAESARGATWPWLQLGRDRGIDRKSSYYMQYLERIRPVDDSLLSTPIPCVQFVCRRSNRLASRGGSGGCGVIWSRRASGLYMRVRGVEGGRVTS